MTEILARLACARALFATVAGLLLALPVFALGHGLAAGSEGLGTAKPIIELRDDTNRVDLLPYSLVAFEDKPWDAPQRLGFIPEVSRFHVPAPGTLRGFIAAKAVWLCFTVRSAASSRSWLLEVGPNVIENVSAYMVDPDGSAESLIADTEHDSSEGPRSLSEYAFRLTIGPGQVKTVYLRVASENLLRVEASLWDSFRYLQTDERNSVFVGLLMGVVIAVFLYTLFIAISLREGIYAFYLVYLIGLLFLVFAWGGVIYHPWQIGGAWAAKRAIPFFSSVMGFGMAGFARRFLDLKFRSAPLSRILGGVAAAALFFAVGLAVFDLRIMTAAGIFLDMAARLLILIAALYSVSRGGSRRERYFLGSWICATIGAAASRVGAIGLFDPSLASLWGHSEQAGVLVQVLLLAYGITEDIDSIRKEKEEGQSRSIELLERANKVKEDFVIGTSLEFRSPLLGIVGLVDAMDDIIAERAAASRDDVPRRYTVGDAVEERRISALIRAEALRLLGSVANIAAYVRLRNGDLALVAERVSLRDIVDSAAGSASYVAFGKSIAVEKAVEEAEIETDSRVLEQILYNLLADAFKRSPSGIVRIEASAKGDRVRIAVLDSAPSLTSEVLFRFSSESKASGPEAVGPGLELLVARLLAERLGGSLGYSWSEGHGRFDLGLPRECSWWQTGRAAERGGFSTLMGRIAFRGFRQVQADLVETPPGKLSRGLVLAYDEDPVFLEALKRYLEGRGYSVVPTLSADAAVALASARSFDLVLLDASAHGHAGLEACAHIRAFRSMDELPIVVMTDRESAEAVEAAFRAGASDYLPKLSPNELLFARVDTHVALRHAVEEAMETRRRVAELEKLKTLGVLAAGVAHEVNTPNNAVIRNLPVISEIWRELSPSILRLMKETEGFSVRGWTAEELMHELPELLADTYVAGLQIKKIVEDLKDYARDSSRSPPESVDISAVAAYATRLLQPLVNRSTRRFVLEAIHGLPPVKANFQKLTQVAVSVLENALQSLRGLDSGVTMRTRFDSDRNRVVLECVDEGTGISPALMEKVFEPFFTTKSDTGGTGLGLSVALGIVRDAGGEIEIESQQGRGTTVRIVLPPTEPDPERGNDERRE